VNLARRKKDLAFGLSFAALPIVLWAVVPASFVLKFAASFRWDERLVEAYAFMCGALFQLAAIYFFNRIAKRPPDRAPTSTVSRAWEIDWVSIGAVAAGVVSVLAIFVFFGAVTAVTLQGW
jgi:hypothetical protein